MSFSKHSSFKDGRNSTCKDCKNAEARSYYVENIKDDWARRDLHNAKKREVWRLQKYGVSKEEYLEKYALQEGKCAVCNEWFEVLCQDHCHNSLLNRGLLCRKCNLGLGYFNDNQDLLKSAIKYLDLYGSMTESGKVPNC